MTVKIQIKFFRSQLIWIYTVWKGRLYPGSAGQWLNRVKLVFFCFLVVMLDALWSSTSTADQFPFFFFFFFFFAIGIDFTVWELHQEVTVRFHASKASFPPLPHSYLLTVPGRLVCWCSCLCVGGFIWGVCFAIICAHLSLLWCLGKTVLRDCDISWYINEYSSI